MNTAVIFGLILGAIFGFCIGVAFTVVQDAKIRTPHETSAVEILSSDDAYKGLIPRASIIIKCLEILNTSHNAYEHDVAKDILRYTLDVPAVDEEQ